MASTSQSKQAQADAKIDEQMEQVLLTDDTGDEAELLRANAKPGEVVEKDKEVGEESKKGQAIDISQCASIFLNLLLFYVLMYQWLKKKVRD